MLMVVIVRRPSFTHPCVDPWWFPFLCFFSPLLRLFADSGRVVLFRLSWDGKEEEPGRAGEGCLRGRITKVLRTRLLVRTFQISSDP